MPFVSKIGGGSARRFGLSRRSVFYTCNTNTAIVTLNTTDRKCYYPSNYAATNNPTFGGWFCQSGGANCGTQCCGKGSPCNAGCCGWCTGDCNYCGGHNSGYTDGSGVTYCTSRPDYCYTAATYNNNNYSCPTNGSIVSLSGSTCVYPAAYDATENG